MLAALAVHRSYSSRASTTDTDAPRACLLLKAKASPGLQLAGKVKLVFHACVERLSPDYTVSHHSGKALALAPSLGSARLTGQNICWLCSGLSLS